MGRARVDASPRWCQWTPRETRLQLTNAFDAPRPPDEIFGLLLDPGAVVHCVPGAEFLGPEGGAFKGRIAVRLGPVALKFNGVVEISDVDRAARTALVRGRGADAQGRGNALAVTKLAVAPAGEGSRVTLVTDLQLSGMVAQYGRAQGVIAAVSNEIVAQFARNLSLALGGEEPSGADKEISGLKLAWLALRARAGK
jgi:carbon monoxide dehydrogenase subunit G